MESNKAQTAPYLGLTCLKGKNIYVVAPGGCTAKGGMARMVKYMVESWPADAGNLKVLDSYGPGTRYSMPPYFMLLLIRLLVAALFAQIDVLHIHMAERLSVTRKGIVIHIASFFRIPIVLHMHGGQFEDYCRALSPRRLSALKRTMAKVHTLVMLGECGKSFVQNYLDVEPSRVRIVPNAVPAQTCERKNFFRSAETTCSIVFLGRVCDRKGVSFLISALSSPSLAGLDWHCEIVGDGNLERYESKAGELGIRERITFHGWQDQENSRRILASADFLVLPSCHEVLPMAILEAMSLGLPTIATPVGEVRDVVRDGVTGLIVPVGDTQALSEALGDLIRNPGKRVELGQEAYRLYLSSFDIAIFNKRMSAVFLDAMQTAVKNT